MPGPCYFFSPMDRGIAYLRGNRLFNFRVEEHGDHVHCDMSIHLVRNDADLGGGRCCPTIQLLHFGCAHFRLPVLAKDYDWNVLLELIEGPEFQECALGPLDDLAGAVDPTRFGMLPD